MYLLCTYGIDANYEGFRRWKTGGSDANQSLIVNGMERNFPLPSHSSLLPCHRYR